MELTPPSGIFSTPKQRLRDTLAACFWFRSWTGPLLSEADAAKRIYLEGLPTLPNNQTYTREKMHDLRPFAIIYTTGMRIMADSEPGGWHPEGSFTIEFEQNVPDDIRNDPAEIDRLFDNRLGSIVYTGKMSQPGLMDLAGVKERGYTDIKELFKDGPWRTAEAELHSKGDASIYYLHITWGVTVR